MKNFKALLLLLGLALVAPQIAPAQDAASEQERTLDDIINDAMTPK